jgi:hypothetical protein
MHSYYYGVHPTLAYILNHFFYNAVHYTYLAAEYFPYNTKNPSSSNPHDLYERLYRGWSENDEFSDTIKVRRMYLRTGVLAKESQGVITHALSIRLRRICDRIDLSVFYPLVYRVDIKTIKRARLVKSGSGLVGSSEYLITDLNEGEINDLLFLDYEKDEIIKIVKYEFNYFRNKSRYRTDPSDVLAMLEKRLI